MKKNKILPLLLLGIFGFGLAEAAYDPFSPSNIPFDLVQRDASGNFAAGTITAALNGNANTVSTVGGQSVTNVAAATVLVNSLTYVRKDGTTPLTGNWNAGAFRITANGVALGSASQSLSGVSLTSNLNILTPTNGGGAAGAIVAQAGTDGSSGNSGSVLTLNGGGAGGGGPSASLFAGNGGVGSGGTLTLGSGSGVNPSGTLSIDSAQMFTNEPLNINLNRNGGAYMLTIDPLTHTAFTGYERINAPSGFPIFLISSTSEVDINGSGALTPATNGNLRISAGSGQTTNLTSWRGVASSGPNTAWLDVNANAFFPSYSLLDSSSNALTLAVPSVITPYTLTLPAAQGSASTTLSNDGSGNLSWVATASPPVTLQGIWYVNKTGTDSASCGSITSPCLTITQTLTNVGPSTTAAMVKQAQTVIVGPGAYDESLVIPHGRLMTLQAQGTVTLGNGLGANGASTDSQNILFTTDSTFVFGSDQKPSLTLIALPEVDATSSFTAEGGVWQISGNITVNDAGSPESTSLNLSSVKVWGNISDTTASLVNWDMYRSRVKGTSTQASGGDQLILERAFDSEFDGLVSITSYNTISDSYIGGGMTVTAAMSVTAPNINPAGMYNSYFDTGTFTGPALSFIVDANTFQTFTQSGASLAGGATTIYLDTAIGVGYTPATPSNWAVTPTTVKQALDELAPASNSTTTAEAAIPGAITWAGAADPTGVTSEYRYSMTGKQVLFSVSINSSAAGTANTSVSFPLPPAAPTPHTWTNNTGNSPYQGAGQLALTTAPDLTISGQCFLSLVSSVWTVTIADVTAIATQAAWCTVSYQVN